MIGVDYDKHNGHALLAIGYEQIDENITKIFCLDPGCDIDTTSYWNAVVRLDNNNSTKYRDSYIRADGKQYKVVIGNALKIEKRK